MIHYALKFFSKELDGYLHERSGGVGQTLVVLGNVAQVDGEQSEQLKDKVIISLVNIEEEGTLKNQPNFRRTMTGAIHYENPPLFLNLYVLITANFTDYFTALGHLSAVTEFFQGRSEFNFNNATHFPNPLPEYPDLTDMNLTLSLYTMTFEQVNHLWGSLGGRQIPFLMYKMRLVPMTDRRQTGSGAAIEAIDIVAKGLKPS